jgi:hypothetical protein
VLRRVGEAPAWVVEVCLTLWIAGLAALTSMLWRLYRVLGTGEFDTPPLR